MKKLIASLLFVLVLNLNAQIVVKLSRFYMFKHDAQYTTFDALNNDLETKRGGCVSDITLTFDTVSMTLSQYEKYDNSTKTFKITEINYLSDDATTFMVKNDKDLICSYTYFQNTPTQKQVLCVWREGLFEFYGWQSVVVE